MKHAFRNHLEDKNMRIPTSNCMSPPPPKKRLRNCPRHAGQLASKTMHAHTILARKSHAETKSGRKNTIPVPLFLPFLVLYRPDQIFVFKGCLAMHAEHPSDLLRDHRRIGKRRDGAEERSKKCRGRGLINCPGASLLFSASGVVVFRTYHNNILFFQNHTKVRLDNSSPSPKRPWSTSLYDSKCGSMLFH